MHLIGICGYSGSGKTTLLKKLIPLLEQAGIRLAVIKHCHHDVDIDVPGKDSYELRKSGAEQIIVASDNRWALITETPHQPANLLMLAKQFVAVDLVLVEGFKDEAINKIVCYRQALNKPFFYDDNTIAVITDVKLAIPLPQFNFEDMQIISHWIKNYLINH